MIKLTDETKVITKDTKNYRTGDIVDNSLYLVRFDSNNLALKRGETIENYFGDVRTALRVSLNYALKWSSVAMSLESILEMINGMDDVIKQLRIDCIEKD